MKQLSKQNKIVITILVILILLQLVAVAFSTSKRAYYHIDEYYSHALIQYKQAFIYQSDDFMGQWHDKDYFEDYLRINEDQKFDFSPVYQNQIEDVHPPLYYLLLRIACSFNIGEFSIWPGTILNMIIAVFCTILLFKIGKEVFENQYYALVLCCINAFSIASIETIMYVRMYQLVILIVLGLMYWHIKKKEIRQLKLKDVVPLFFIVLIGFLTHYYSVIIVGVLWLIYMIGYVRKKEKHNALMYTGTLLGAGLTGLVIFPFALQHIFMGYRGQEVLENMFHISNIAIKIAANLIILNQELFNGYLGILGILMFVIVLLAIGRKIYIMQREKKQQDVVEPPKEINPNIKYIAIPMIIYLMIIVIASPYRDLRYIMPIIPIIFCSLLYLIKGMLQILFRKKTTFLIILTIAVLFSVSVIPKLSNNSYTYTSYEKKLNLIKEQYSTLPWVFVYEQVPVNANKTMQCYGVFLEVDEVYVMDKEKVNVKEMEKVLAEKDVSDGVIVVAHASYAKKVVDTMQELGDYTEQKIVCSFMQYIVCLFK